MNTSAKAYEPPGRIAVWAFTRYFRALFRRHFASVRWHALDDPRGWDRSVPVLLVANHTNWWDGFFSVLLTHEMKLTCHVLMEAQHLDRYPAFRRIGTLPVRRNSHVGAWRDLHDAGSALRPGTALWIYPQGKRCPAGEPLRHLERGAAQLVLTHGSPVRVVPVGFRYPFTSEQQPEALALIGSSWITSGPGDRRELTQRVAEAMSDTLARLDARIATESLSEFRTLVPGRLSINKRMDKARHAMGLLRGPFEARNG